MPVDFAVRFWELKWWHLLSRARGFTLLELLVVLVLVIVGLLVRACSAASVNQKSPSPGPTLVKCFESTIFYPMVKIACNFLLGMLLSLVCMGISAKEIKCARLKAADFLTKNSNGPLSSKISTSICCLQKLAGDESSLSQMSDVEILNVASLLSLDDADVQMAAAGVLASLGPRAKIALPKLQEALEDWRKSISTPLGPSMAPGYVFEWAISEITGNKR